MVGTLLLIVVVVIEHVVIPSLSLAAAVIVKVIVGLRLCLSSEDVLGLWLFGEDVDG